jgi:hypothetical protein
VASYPYAVEAYVFLAQIRVNSGDVAGARSIIDKGLSVVDDARLRQVRDRLRAMR